MASTLLHPRVGVPGAVASTSTRAPPLQAIAVAQPFADASAVSTAPGSYLPTASRRAAVSLGWQREIGQDYRLGNVLGRGANGVVRAATNHHSGATVAIKILPKTAEMSSRTGRRVKMFSSLLVSQARDEGAAWALAQAGPGGESVVRLLESYEDEEFVYFVSEFCQGGSLQALMRNRKLTETETARVMLCVVRAIAACHSKNILHGDAKPSNFLLATSYPGAPLDVKLTDFGCARPAPDGTFLSDRRLGTPLYRSPESFLTGYDKSADNWAAGVIAYQITTGHMPFWRDWSSLLICSERDVASHITQKPIIYDDDEWRNTSPMQRDFVTRLLDKNPASRMSAEEALHHPFLAQIREAES